MIGHPDTSNFVKNYPLRVVFSTLVFDMLHETLLRKNLTPQMVSHLSAYSTQDAEADFVSLKSKRF